MTFNRFAAGKKVYSHGSYAPTRGTVNPQGYVERELKRRSLLGNNVPGRVHSTPKPMPGGFVGSYGSNKPKRSRFIGSQPRRPAPIPGSPQHSAQDQIKLAQNKVAIARNMIQSRMRGSR